MFHVQNFKYSFILFYCFGQAPYFPFRNRATTKSSWLLKFLPLIVLICVFLGSGYIVFHNYLKPLAQTNNILSYILTLLSYAPNFSVIYVNVIDPYGVIYLHRGLISIAKFTKIQLNGKACDGKFQKLYKQMIFIMFLCYLVNTSVRCNILSPFKNVRAELSLSIMSLYKVCSFMHAMFYLYAIRFMFVSINTAIDEKDFDAMIEMCSMLGGEFKRSMADAVLYFDRLRLHYFKLSEVIAQFNERFGWSLLALIIDSSISAADAIYWLFVYPSSMDNGIYLIWRKYFFVFLWFDLLSEQAVSTRHKHLVVHLLLIVVVHRMVMIDLVAYKIFNSVCVCVFEVKGTLQKKKNAF